jgi:hypothetical protein
MNKATNVIYYDRAHPSALVLSLAALVLAPVL